MKNAMSEELSQEKHKSNQYNIGKRMTKNEILNTEKYSL
jgi:hypothetical protein